MTGDGRLFLSARSALERRMQHTGTEPSNLPRFPVEFLDIPAIERDAEVRPNKTADDYWQKPFHSHGRDLSMPNSIRRFWFSGATWLCTCLI